MDKAIRAQTKAYTIHNRPVYLFQLAGMFEFSGGTSKAIDFSGTSYRRRMSSHLKIDAVFLNQADFDLNKIIALEKVR